MSLELIRKDIKMTKSKGNSDVQITLDDDFNVPDIKPDIDKIIQEQAEININNIETMNEKVKVAGALEFTILYLTESDQKPIHSMTGTIPFEEIVYLDGILEDDDVKMTCEIEDLRTSLINSRKISVKGISSLKMLAEENYCINVAVDVEGAKDVQYIDEEITISQVFANTKDTYRIRDELALPSSKPNIMEILWTDANIRNPEVRLLDDKLNVKGEVHLFVLYMGESDEKPVEFVEFELPFNGIIDCDHCLEEMIANVTMGVLSKDIAIRPDLDGEERLLDVEIITDLDIKVYNQENVRVLKDVYAPAKEVILKKKPVTYDTILLKNQTQCKVTEKVAIKDSDPKILQICYTDGKVKVDDLVVTEEGIEVEGVIFTQIMYVAADDKMPMNVIKEIVPFKHTIEVKGINDHCVYEVKPSLDYVSCNMLDDKEVEIRCGVNMNAMVFNKNDKEIITEIEEQEMDLKKIQELPSIVGYIVKRGDSLWDIAKRYCTTTEKIKKINELSDQSELKPGDKIIIVKNVESLVQ